MAGAQSKADDSPRIFALHKYDFSSLQCRLDMAVWTVMLLDAMLTADGRIFYQMRVDRLRNIEIARRNRERLKDPSFFPSVPNKTPWVEHFGQILRRVTYIFSP